MERWEKVKHRITRNILPGYFVLDIKHNLLLWHLHAYPNAKPLNPTP